MEDELELTRAQLAQRIGFSAAVLRKWEKDFAEFVTSPAGVKGLAKARVYNLDDVLLFATIAQLRTEGLSLDAIRAKLPERLAQARAQLDEGLVIGVYDDLILLHAPAEDKIYSLRLTNSDSVTLSD